MLLSSGLKIFDRQCHGGLITGNVLGDAQLSWYIRPKHATECNGHSFAPGELLAGRSQNVLESPLGRFEVH
jgi:hypothetical protein